MAPKLTPMMQQYLAAKERYPHALLFFRMGDFYELFFEDAEVAARQLQITLTTRGKQSDEDIPMAGVPHHAADSYISQLIENGFSVAICEQLEDPSLATGIVRRDVVRVVTPGVVLDTNTLDAKTPNYVAALYGIESASTLAFGVAYLDVSTGNFRCTAVSNINDAVSEISRVEPREMLVNATAATHLAHAERELGKFTIRTVDEDDFSTKKMRNLLARDPRLSGELNHDSYFLTADDLEPILASIKNFPFKNLQVVERAVAGTLIYIIETQRGVPSHVSSLTPYETSSFLVIDDATRVNLELTQTLMGGKKKGSLLSVIDQTVTPLGARLLRHWLAYPLLDVAKIENRLDAVEEIFRKPAVVQDLRQAFEQVYDLERLCGRLTAGNANARDLRSLVLSLNMLPNILEILNKLEASLWGKMIENFDPYNDLRDLLTRAIVDDPPVTINEGGLFKRGYHDELDEIIELSDDGKSWMLKYEQQLREDTGISSLKVRFNKVFGYFIEVTKSNLSAVPEHFIRKQTLTNAERYFTPELKEMEEKILHAKERRHSLEYELFQKLRRETSSWISALLETSRRLATIDVLVSFATIAKKNDYSRPMISDGGLLKIFEGRHPVVEKNLRGERFIPNDVTLDCEGEFLQIITGPNMSGKSTVIRQVALIVIMAQMGCFVPAKSAIIGVVDKVFSRVGASDNLARGESTFMVEMSEAAHILKNATNRSLIILDEIGRGTSTFDGLSIAWAVAEYIHDTIGARTMFATHYHELTELTRTLKGAVNMSIAAKEWNDDIIFLRKLVKGEANRSYGIQVGKLAGLPDTVIERAKEVLENLESCQFDEAGVPIPSKKQRVTVVPNVADADQLSLFSAPPRPPSEPWKDDIIEKLERTNINSMTPMQAMMLLDEVCQKIAEKMKK